MSLFNDISQNLLSEQSSLGGVNFLSSRSLIDAGLDAVSGGVAEALGGSQLSSALGMMASNQLSRATQGYLDANTLNSIDSGLGIANDLLNGQFSSAGLRLLGSGLFNDLIPGLSGILAQARYLNTATPMFGGITPLQAKQIIGELNSIDFAHKNLFLIEVSSALYGDVSRRFNMYCTEANYSAQAITGEKRRIGGAQIDSVNSADATEINLTTFDDKTGFIKEWFKAHAAACVHKDGTVGVPADYAITFKLLHAYITQETNYNGYQDIGMFRPANIDTSLSRREDGLEELTMSFSQLDTFMSV
ncbi:hypothetical protein [Methylocucumis oryzae]|uniref:Uncharacterized protein n=1 Tax=Methylocucumis oryzae TaxID=1632867 RepID=A0A0F3INF1_9GAMM|nr:hypothetical protein [Methylocucumis oryzae]KJV08088.1 hypothetical protein VZ94_00580 [Methylocucumis oryzae]